MEKVKRKRKTIKPKHILLLAVCAVIIGLALFSFNAEKLAGNPLPMPFGFGAAVVLSNSMAPELNTGDIVFVSKTDELAEGDIIVYQSGYTLVVHRVIGIDSETVLTKGDANNAPDEPFDRSAVKGRVTGKIPFVGYIVRIIRTPIGLLVIFAAAALLLAHSLRAEKKKDNKELDELREEIEKLKGEQNKKDD